jgi:hypothetical protein
VIPLALLVLVPVALDALGGAVAPPARRGTLRRTAPVLALVAWMALLGGRDALTHGYGDRRAYAPLLAYVRTLPKDALLAGFPTQTDDIPLLARRRVLISREAHQVFHEGYLLEMRRRMAALVAAYYATDLGPVERLRDALGVTHLIADRQHYGDAPPRYFPPFEADMQAAWRTARVRGAVVPTLPRAYDDGRWLVVDLRSVGPRAGSTPPGAAPRSVAAVLRRRAPRRRPGPECAGGAETRRGHVEPEQGLHVELEPGLLPEFEEACRGGRVHDHDEGPRHGRIVAHDGRPPLPAPAEPGPGLRHVKQQRDREQHAEPATVSLQDVRIAEHEEAEAGGVVHQVPEP